MVQTNDAGMVSTNNDLTLYPPFSTDYPGAALEDQNYGGVNVFGNTLESAGHGFVYAAACGNAVIMNNNFANVTYRGIGIGQNGGSIQSAIIFNNILGEGATFHVQLPLTNNFGWFLQQNEYLNAASNSVAPFLDPAGSAVHIN